jgi:hypothetical protein
MKHLLLLFFFSGSLDSFSQGIKPDVCYHNAPACNCSSGKIVDRVPTSDTTRELWLINGAYVWKPKQATPDTLRAIILVTLSPNGIAHARMGYVVVQDGKRPVYLDCRKRALKLPHVGWGYVIVNPKEN